MDDLLKPQNCFINSFNEFVDIFKEYGTSCHFKNGEIMKDINTPITNSYYLLSGFCQLDAISDNSEVKTLIYYGPDSLFPHYIFNPQKRLLNNNIVQTAISDVEALAISQSDLKTLMEKYPAIHWAMTADYEHLVQTLVFDIVHQTYNNSMTRVCTFLIMYQYAHNTNLINITQEELSEMIGLSRSNVARQISFLKRQRIITDTATKKYIEILKPKELMQYCHHDTL